MSVLTTTVSCHLCHIRLAGEDIDRWHIICQRVQVAVCTDCFFETSIENNLDVLAHLYLQNAKSIQIETIRNHVREIRAMYSATKMNENGV